MGWSIGYDRRWNRDIGYGVPATCDHPGCNAEIDRGLAYVCCDQQPYGGDKGCGLYFCYDHRSGALGRCARCMKYRKPFKPTPDTREWMEHKLTDDSWAAWRAENPDDVAAIRNEMAK
jgi:hypothetical protein